MIAGLALRFDVIAIGAMAGLGYAILAAGLLLVYRAGRVINLAHGQIGAFCSVVLLELVHKAHLPYAVALPLALATGAAIGVLIERTLVAPLARRSVLAVLVATIGVTQVLLVAQALLPKVLGGSFPTPFEWTFEVRGLVLHGEHAALLLFGPAALAMFITFLQRSRHGLAIRSVADNRQAAELAGIDPRRVGMMVWAVAGALAALAAILTLPLAGGAVGTGASSSLGPALLVRALAAGLAGRLVDLRRTVAAGVAIGIVEAVLFASYPTNLGLVDLVLFVGIVVMLLTQREARDESAALVFAGEPAPIPARFRNLPIVRRARPALAVAALGIGLVAPLLWTSSSQLFLLSRVPVFAIIGISIVVLTGWAGQLSLGQMAFVGFGACGSAALASRGVPYGAAIGYVVCAGVLVSLAVGIPALRLRGLFLTVTTLAFAVAASSYLLSISAFRTGGTDVRVIDPGKVGPIDAGSFRTDYYLCLAALAATIALARRLRHSGIGRTIVAVEENDRSAAAMTVSPSAAKLTAFAVAGGLATLAGALLAGVTRTFQLDAFTPEQSLQVLAMTVVGGVGSIAGAVAGACYLVGVPTLFGDSTTARLATSGIGLLVLMRIEPAGLVALVARARDALLARFAGSAVQAAESGTDRREPAVRRRLDHDDGNPPSLAQPGDAGPVLAADDISVLIGGRTIIDSASVRVESLEIVGLIGANGAGKTTLMNAIGGFVPATGRVLLNGTDLSGVAPHQRARAGLGRAFQTARLFPRLTARECVQVALEAQRRSEIVPSLLALPPAVRTERWSKAAADDLLDLFGLGRFADVRAGTLSTGTRRIVELACLLATRPALVLLDEPMAGIAQRETEAFVPLLHQVRDELGAAMLVIEHDLPLICAISDRLYCMETGRVIAEGAPDAVRSDPRVIASYLGSDERAVARSGSVASTGAGLRTRRVPKKAVRGGV